MAHCRNERHDSIVRLSGLATLRSSGHHSYNSPKVLLIQDEVNVHALRSSRLLGHIIMVYGVINLYVSIVSIVACVLGRLVLEESPSPFVSSGLVAAVCAATQLVDPRMP